MTGVRRTQRGGVSSAKALLRPGADDWLFVIGNDNRVITLIEQFDEVLDLAGITYISHGDKYALSLRHFYNYLEKSLARNTTGRLAWFGSAKNLRDALSSITVRNRIN
jgi:hypothetical protein